VYSFSDEEYHEMFTRSGNTFTVYCSISQNTWRFCEKKPGEDYQKGEHYTATTVVHPDLQTKLDSEYDSLEEREWSNVYVPRTYVYNHFVNDDRRADKENILYNVCKDDSLPFIDEPTLLHWMRRTELDIRLSDCLANTNRTKKILTSLQHTLSAKLNLISRQGDMCVYAHNGKNFTFYSRTLSNIRFQGTLLPKIQYTYLITTGTSRDMSPWGMSTNYVPAGILLIKPFEYKQQARSLVTEARDAKVRRDGADYAVNGKNMRHYFFFGDVTSGVFPNQNIHMFDELHRPG